MAILTVAGSTELIVGHGLPDVILPVRAGRQRVAVITQPGATQIALDVAQRLREIGLQVEVIGLPDRDEAKTLAVAESVYEALARFGFGRHDTVVGVGGGSVTDLAGFVAGTWLRGVEVVHIPTTLLAAVDAAIGGKTGVNLAGKNLVGLFWHPTRVVVDVGILGRLPGSLRREGLAEALKAGIVGDPELFDLLATHGEDSELEEVVTRAAAVKARVVGEDERESGVRATLNFGHTIGHAIEFASPLSHGECVAVGMVAAGRISERRLRFPGFQRMVAAIAGLGLPIRVDGLDRARVEDLLRHDKKRDAEGLRMVLLRSLGDPVVEHVDDVDLESGLGAVGL
ncbi:MAG TPA: 3-dehydroquinate synthase family protein [Acidimicrobiia bacterium]|nr:3-dehydroquinate synthase family protein [Acidimicrobiia bacterium]